MKNNNLVYGVGIFDGSFTTIDGVQYIPYSMWVSMLRRCYSKIESDKKKHSSYLGCSVCNDWLTFSNFEMWVTVQPEYYNKQLDKDLLIFGNRIYSPESCVLISRKLNTLITDLRKNNQTYIGSNKSKAYISNPFTNKREYLGSFPSEYEAHLAWKKRKLELGLALATLEQDPRIIEAIKDRYK